MLIKMIITIAAVLFWMVGVVFCAGLLTTKLLPAKRRTYGMVFVNGYMVSIVLFECLYLLFVLLKSTSVQWLGIAFAICFLGYALFSVLLGRECIRDCEENRKKIKPSFFMFAFWILFLIQIIMRLLQQVSDGDDALFVAGANVSAQSGQMNNILIYTGEYSPNPDVRHLLSGLPIWIAVLSRLTGLHASVTAHCVLGIVVLLMHYAILHALSSLLLEEKEEQKWLFMMLTAVFNIFGNVSLYTSQTFLLTRTWQGKTMFANLAIPFAFLILIELYHAQKKQEQYALYCLAVMVYLFAGTCATTGFIIMLLFIPPFLFVVIRQNKRKKQESEAKHV